MKKKRILLFGASTMAGFWDSEGGWFTRLAREVYSYCLDGNHNEFQLYNCSVSGDTSEDLLERLETELEARREAGKEIVTLVSIGGNDALYMREEGHNQVSPERSRENLQKLLEQVERLSEEVYFISGTPFDWELTDPLQWDESLAYRKEDLEKYERIQREVCEEKRIEFIDLNSRLSQLEDWNSMLEDGVHPSSEGHMKMKEILREELRSRGVLPSSL